MKTFILITKIMNGTVTTKVEIHGIRSKTFEDAMKYVKALQFYKERGINNLLDKEGFYFQVKQDDPGLMVFCQLNKVELGFL